MQISQNAYPMNAAYRIRASKEHRLVERQLHHDGRLRAVERERQALGERADRVRGVDDGLWHVAGDVDERHDALYIVLGKNAR